MDDPLLNRLWDFTSNLLILGSSASRSYERRSRSCPVVVAIWIDFYELSIDTLAELHLKSREDIKKWFYEVEWNHVYDLIEFCLNLDTPGVVNYRTNLISRLNESLERCLSAYRFIGSEFAPVTNPHEIAAIEQAIVNPLNGVRAHIAKALAYLADRGNPDPANSIKEAISAVESLCSAIVGKPSTLGEALKKLQANGIDLHPALVKGWSSLYGYTSDQGGIRHAMQDEPNINVDDATYFLVSCSAFVSLLTTKAQSAGIALAAVT